MVVRFAWLALVGLALAFGFGLAQQSGQKVEYLSLEIDVPDGGEGISAAITAGDGHALRVAADPVSTSKATLTYRAKSNPSPRSNSRSSDENGLVRSSIARAINLNGCLEGLGNWSTESHPSPRLGAEVSFRDPGLNALTPSRSERSVAENHSTSTQSLSRVRLVTFTTDDAESTEPPSVDYWPAPVELIQQIESLQSIPQVTGWAEETLAVLTKIQEVAPVSNEMETNLVRLSQLNQQLSRLSGIVWNAAPNSPEAVVQAAEVARMGYRISRRLAVWNSIRRAALPSHHLSDGWRPMSSAAFNRISFEGLDARWVDYLKLNDLQQAFRSLNPDRDEQKQAARDVLSRFYSPVLKPDQAKFVQQAFAPEIIDWLKQQASDPVDSEQLLVSLERYESTPSSYAGDSLNDAYQDLLWSSDANDQRAASEIHTHYRNANFRLAVHERLLNRLIPRLPTIAMPVSETIKGAHVSGQSHVSNELRVEFIPDPNQLSVRLETAGNVQSDTVARTKSFRILNQGEARFQVFKQLAIGRNGIDASQQPVAHTSANQQVVGVESKLDNVPILGWMARKLAFKKLRDEAPETDRMFRQKVESSATSKMQQEVESQLARLRVYAYNNLYQPLLAMELEPDPVQMSTTEDQVIMRYRLAGRDQMAANTARPRDDGTSLLSFQMHQSTVNNAIARIGLNGNTFTVDELTTHLREVIGSSQVKSPEDADQNREAEFGFAHFDPIRIDFVDNRMNITLNFSSLQIDNGRQWRNVSLKAAYRVRAQDMQIVLEQDDQGTRIKGRRLGLRDKAAMSTVMKVLFEKEYTLNALPQRLSERIGGEQLRVSQLVLSDGWLGVSIDDRYPPPTAQQETVPNGGLDGQRIGTLRRLINRR